MGKKKFPTFAAIIIVLGVWWLLEDLGIINTKVPFWPLLLIIVGISLVVNKYKLIK